ncbi:hypothetical protein MBANPS3_002489 [Mucor bainieri]
MVSFVSISQGISLFIVVSSMLAGSAHAAPASSHSSSSKNATTSDASTFTLPPIISSRVTPPKVPSGSHNVEDANVAKNKKWFEAHGGKLNVTKRADETVGGYTMDLPSNAPPLPSVPSASTVVIASTAQISEFKKYAGIASTAYCRSVVPLNQWSCTNCLKFVPDGKLIKTFTSLITDTNGFVLRSDAQKTIYVVFRGTNSIRSAITDLVFDLTNYTPVSGAKVHTGFYASYKAVVSDYFPAVQSQLTAYPGYKVIVTGHSLGGAQALLAGMDLFQRESRLNKNNLAIYTVGCPRVGNPAFAYYVDSTGITFSRSVNNRDIVPHVPPQAWGFLHPGVEAWARSSSNVQICTPNIETGLCSNSIVPFTSFTDHLTYYDLNEGLCL